MNWKGVATITVGLSCVLASAQGPNQTLYITGNGGANLVMVKGNTETFGFTAFGDEGPIAVDGAIATSGISTGQFGGSYNLSGIYTGGFYASALTADATDATTDGTHNYVIDANGYVYSTGSTYQSPKQLFWAGPNATGISYDPLNKSLWVDVGGALTDFTTQGATLSAFETTLVGYTALAFSPTDNTLWAGTDSGGGSFLTAYSPTSGRVEAFDNLGSVTIEGMEFDEAAVTPEPQSVLPFALGIALFVRRKRSRLSPSPRVAQNGGSPVV